MSATAARLGPGWPAAGLGAGAAWAGGSTHAQVLGHAVGGHGQDEQAGQDHAAAQPERGQEPEGERQQPDGERSSVPPAAEQGPGQQPGGQPQAGAGQGGGLLGRGQLLPAQEVEEGGGSSAGPWSDGPQPAAADAGRPDRDAAAQGLDHPAPADHHRHMPPRRALGCGR